MKIKMMKKFLLWSIVFLILINSALALGIRPAKTEITFMPGLVQNYSFKVANNDNKSLNVVIYVEGDLKDYIKLHQTEAHLGVNEEFKEVPFSVELPAALLPGTKTTQIIVEEALSDVEVEGQTFAAKLKVAHKINVNVPYPNKYIEADVSYEERKKDILFNIDVQNVGRFDISSVEGRLSIFDTEHEIANITTNKKGIRQGSSAGLTAVLDKTSVGNGIYNLIASISYDEAILELSRELMIGKPNIRILNYKADRYLIAGKIGRIDIDLKNEWNKAQSAFVEISISDKTRTVSEKSVSFDIAPRETKKIEQYIDLREFPTGDYAASISLFYGNLTASENFTIHLVNEEEYVKSKEKAVGGISIYTIAVFIVSGAFTLLLVWFFARRRHSSTITSSVTSAFQFLYLQCKYKIYFA